MLRIRDLVVRRGLTGFSATSENIYQMADAAPDMLFHGAFRQTQQLRGFPLGQSLHLAQHEGFAASRRQQVDRVGNQAKFLALFCLNIGRQVIGGEVQPLYFAQRFHGYDRRSTQFAGHHRQRGAKEIGARIFDMVDRCQAGELGVGFLNDVVNLQTMLDPPRKPAP